MSADKTLTIEAGDGTVELLYGTCDPEAFLTVRRERDGEDDYRVAILHPAQALLLAQALIEHVRNNFPGSAE